MNCGREDRIEIVKEKVAGLSMEYLGCIPYDAALEELVFNGESIYKLDGSPAVLKIDEIMKAIGVE